MHRDRSWKISSQIMAVLTLAAALAGCGGSSSASVAPTAVPTGATGTGVTPTTPPPPATSGSGGSSSGSNGGTTGSSGSGGGSSGGGSSGGGSSGGGSSGGGSSGGGSSGGGSGGGSTTDILFEQPQESGVTGGLYVPPATHKAPPKGVFALILWQANPDRSDGQLVPTAWDAGSQTGFTPSSASTAQLGFQNKAGTSTVQMDGDTVGVYLNSADLPSSTAGAKMMVTPQFIFTTGNEPMPFASSNSSLSASMDLQVPTALGNAYVVADFEFTGPNGVRISYGVALFHNGAGHPAVASGYDAPSNSYMLNSPLGVDQRFVTKAQGSGSYAGASWQGWQHFEWSISETQFVAALTYLAAKYPTQVQSIDPASYVLDKVHLNAECHFPSAPAELGWSMRGWKVWVTS